MTPEAAARAAGMLLAARRAARRIEALPAELRPATAEEGYQVQDAFIDQSGDRPVGFKIGATSRRAQDFLSCDAPFVGTVLAGDLIENPARLSAGRFTFRLIEPEFAVTLGRDLPPREAEYTMKDMAEAVAGLHPAIEVVTSVLENWADQGVPSLIADNGVNGALVLGPACRDWRDLDLARHEVTLSVNDAPAGSGRGANALGHPLAALAWLAKERARRGRGLAAGQVVTTGVVTEFVELCAGDEAVADFGALGEARVRFTG